MKIRNTEPSDNVLIRDLYHAAFGADENVLVAELACRLITEHTSPEAISLVAEEEGSILGHIALSPIFAKEDHRAVGYILAPLAVLPQKQKSGIGKTLVQSGMKEAERLGAAVICVYGDPTYYSRFGFTAEFAERFIPPYQLKYPSGWLGVVLDDSHAAQDSVSITTVEALSSAELW